MLDNDRYQKDSLQEIAVQAVWKNERTINHLKAIIPALAGTGQMSDVLRMLNEHVNPWTISAKKDEMEETKRLLESFENTKITVESLENNDRGIMDL